MPLADATSIPLETGDIVREPQVYKGQRNFPGWYYAATCERLIVFESWLERDHFTLMDQDPSVVGFASQPFRLHWNDESGRPRHHVPDAFVRRVDGSAVVIDIRPANRVADNDRARFDMTAAAATQAGWGYEVRHEPETVRLANVKWLAGYRRPNTLLEPILGRIVDVSVEPVPISLLVDLLGGTPLERSAVFHGLWRSDLVADLETPLHEHALVVAA